MFEKFLGESFFKGFYYRWKASQLIGKNFDDFYRNPDLMNDCSKWNGIPIDILRTIYYKNVDKNLRSILVDVINLAKADHKDQANALLENLFPESYKFRLVIVQKKNTPPSNIIRN
jgi:hypothetical protein